jgi:hypothetical protein
MISLKEFHVANEKIIESKVTGISARMPKIPSRMVDSSFLKRLFNILDNAIRQAGKIAAGQLQQIPGQSIDEYNKLKESIQDSYKIEIILVYGSRKYSKGKFLLGEDEEILNESNLKATLTNIIFTNIERFQRKFNMLPGHSIRLELDFNRGPIFDFSVNPSKATEHLNVLEIKGSDDNWVAGTEDTVLDLFRDGSNKYSWFHQKNIYDIILWPIVFPLSFLYLHRIQLLFGNYLLPLNGTLQVFLYIYFIIVVLLLFRILFNFARWLFPYMELRGSGKRRPAFLRWFLGSICAAVIVDSLKNFILKIIAKLI